MLQPPADLVTRPPPPHPSWPSIIGTWIGLYFLYHSVSICVGVFSLPCWINAGPAPLRHTPPPPHLHLPCRYGAEGAKITGPARPPSPPPGSERLLLNNMVTPRFLKPAEKLICFRSVETVKDISRRFFLMNMKGLRLLWVSYHLFLLFGSPWPYLRNLLFCALI